ncbi:hypothetical protein QCA50_005466 [Cerrena zonata]|uniref:Fungal-type protein kinase domain-containing protein n=1 Tax=Cerrena zonata TaxID=2478898 RepID=A0AAW0GFC4_9APHY
MAHLRPEKALPTRVPRFITLVPTPGSSNVVLHSYDKQPVCFKLKGFNQWCGYVADANDRRNFLVDEMVGSFVGPMPAREFLRKFMKFNKNTPRPETALDFSEITGDMTESSMYPIICDIINKSNIFPGYRLVTVANALDEHGIRIRPDLAAVARNLPFSDEKAYNIMDFWLEIKPRRAQDAFTQKEDFTTLEKNNGQSASTRGQLISYAAAVMSRQHRTFLFSLSICGHFARFYRWDRSGCTVSELIDIHKHPEILAYFFSCYSRLSAADRGFDPTVEIPTPQEGRLLRKATAQFEKECKKKGRRNVIALQKPSKSEYPWPAFKVQVKVAGSTRKMIIGRPFWDADSPCGRATRAYLAYDLTEKRLVFLKDSWRTEDDMITAEGIVYERLQEHGVPFLPVVLSAEDVRHGRKIQKTVTQTFANAKVRPKWLVPCATLKTYVHYRVVQEIVFPLISATSSRESVQAIRDAIVAIKIAFETGKLLHRDISAGNIMISLIGRGVLNDWDHALDILLSKMRHPGRTGTWQFLSIGMLMENGKIHEIHDDLESCYWVLLYISFHYFEHTHPTFNINFFDEYEAPRDGAPASGGNKKNTFLTSNRLASNNINWTCKPLNVLLHELTALFQMYHIHANVPPARESDGFLKQHELIGKVDVVLELFDRALASNEWPEKDALEDQMPAKPKNEADKERRNTIATTFATGNDGRAPAPFTSGPNVEVQREQAAEEVQVPEPVADDLIAEPLDDAPSPPPSETVQPRRYDLRSRANLKANEPSEPQAEETQETAPRYLTRSRAKPVVTRKPTKFTPQPRKEAAPTRGRSKQKTVTSKPATHSKRK